MLGVTYEKSGANQKQGAVRVAVRVHNGNCCAGDQDRVAELGPGEGFAQEHCISPLQPFLVISRM